MKLFVKDSPVLLIARFVLAFSWIYQGAVPKLIFRNPVEIELLRHSIANEELAGALIVFMGYGEILFGIMLLFTNRAWIFMLNFPALLSLLLYVGIFQPDLLTLPFNPMIMNISLIGMSLVAYLELRKKRNGADS